MRPDPRFHLSSRREILCAGTAAAMLTIIGTPKISRAQSRIETLQILCGSAGGSGPDIVARRVAEQLIGRYAKSTIVENRPGAAGRIAVNALKLTPADGSTLLLAAVSVVSLNPLLYKKLGYDPEVDIRPVSLAAEMPLALAVGPAVPQNVVSVRELVEWMRGNPALANIGSPGAGSLPHFLEAMLFRQADVRWTHVPFQGGAPAVAALLGGQIAAVILPEAVLSPHQATGKLRVVATSGAQRSLHMPDVPSFVEQGYRELVVLERFALFMSGRVPPATIEAASQAIRQAIAQPELARAFAALGMVAVASTPAELAAKIAAEKRSWESVVRSTGIVVE